MHSNRSGATSPEEAPVLLLTDKELAIVNGGGSVVSIPGFHQIFTSLSPSALG